MQRYGGLARAGDALHYQRPVGLVADDEVLFGLYRGDDLAQPVRAHRAQHRLQVRVLRHHVGVEYRQELAVLYAELALEQQFALYRAVGRGVAHRPQLPRIVQVRHRRAPVHDLYVQRFAPRHAVLAYVVRVCVLVPARPEVHARKVRLARCQAQVVQRHLVARVHHLAQWHSVGIVLARLYQLCVVVLQRGVGQRGLLGYYVQRVVQVVEFELGIGMCYRGHRRLLCAVVCV